MLAGFIIGVCVMSIFTILSNIALDEGKYTLSAVLAGPIMWVWMIFAKSSYEIYKRIALYFFRKNYLQYMTYCHGVIGCEIYYIHKKVVPFFYNEKDGSDKYIKFLRSCKDVKSLPFKNRKISLNGIGRKYKEVEKYISNYVRPDTEFYKKMSH